ncbi:SGNH/GDSL hydrolase family protein [Roseobacteraceae bacterium NS-SX3]
MLAADQILRLPLLPLLAAQGLAVRRKALILPEPEGPRAGEAGDGPELRLLIAGDSSAAGVGATHQDSALSGQLAAELSRRNRVVWRLEATTGHTTHDTLERLAALPAQPFDVAVLALGVNDVTRGTSRARFAARQTALMQLLKARFGVQFILASGVPQMQHFPALPQPLAWVLGRQAARLDNALSGLARSIPELRHLPFRLDPDPALAAADGYHPSETAYALWAEILAAELRTALVQAAGRRRICRTSETE